MSEIDNKRIVTGVMEAMARGDSGPFYDAFADDLVWRPMTNGVWGKVHRGKAAARDELFLPLRRQYADRYTNTATGIFADGDHVVVEAQGAVTLKSGKRYDNRYCFVIRMKDGKMTEVREYLDSALAEAVLEPLPA
ncbi:nuclear transport factor 2 family protein [Phenylobacterium sp.]|uniref:nuclear transport factor 2 family protein n=1 Tax=Phenylobacterium sp. TaxID=1871053 RepID=UPI002B85CB10|nr:nuclear transport factor 2 family protein [Phenylobacterium sp.]HVI32984.1 nuclear transport factor 2 family protein [Phenylobacterium sp.]